MHRKQSISRRISMCSTWAILISSTCIIARLIWRYGSGQEPLPGINGLEGFDLLLLVVHILTTSIYIIIRMPRWGLSIGGVVKGPVLNVHHAMTSLGTITHVSICLGLSVLIGVGLHQMFGINKILAISIFALPPIVFGVLIWISNLNQRDR